MRGRGQASSSGRSEAYAQNINLDNPQDPKKRKGYITKQDATTRVREFENKGRNYLSQE